MKHCSAPGFIIVLAMSLLTGLGCSGVQGESESLETLQVDETQADWVRVEVGLSTSHPYENDQLENWQLEAPEQARGIRVHFNEFETEADQDFFVLGEHIYHGNLGSFTTDVAPGHLIPVQFSTDSSTNLYGYDIDYYEYLMPHTALRAQVVSTTRSSFKPAKRKLKLGLPHPTHPQLNPLVDPEDSEFKESHYEALVEHDLIYRCWAYIAPGIKLPEPLTLAIEPTSLFTLQLVAGGASSYPQQVVVAPTFNGKSMTMKMNFKDVDMGVHLKPKVMSHPSFNTKKKVFNINTNAIRGGFGAWGLTQFNQPNQHVKTAPQNIQSPMPPFKLKRFDSITQPSKWTAPMKINSFQIKNIKI